MRLWRDFDTAWNAEDWEALDEVGTAIRSMRSFDAMPDEIRLSVLFRHGFAQFALGQFSEALVSWDEAEAATDDPGIINQWRFYVYANQEDWLAAHATFVTLDDAHPAWRDRIMVQDYYRVINGMRDEGIRVERVDMLQRLIAGYVAPEPFVDLEPMRLRLARLAAETGNMDRALEHVRAFELGSTRNAARIESVFAPLWTHPEFDTLTNVVEAVDGELQAAIEDSLTFPDHMQPLVRQVRLLLALDRPQEAEALARETFARLEAGEAFLDADMEANWLLNAWAYALYALGRIEDGNERMGRGSRLAEHDLLNVSQLINFSSMLMQQGDDSRALETLEAIEGRDVSPYGWMMVWSVRACAHHALGNSDQRDEYLVNLAENWTDAPSGYQRALLCTGNDEAAADLLVRRLEDPVHAASTLDDLQHRIMLFRNSGMDRPLAWRRQLDELAQRPEVVDAIEAVGRIESQPVTNWY